MENTVQTEDESSQESVSLLSGLTVEQRRLLFMELPENGNEQAHDTAVQNPDSSPTISDSPNSSEFRLSPISSIAMIEWPFNDEEPMDGQGRELQILLEQQGVEQSDSSSGETYFAEHEQDYDGLISDAFGSGPSDEDWEE